MSKKSFQEFAATFPDEMKGKLEDLKSRLEKEAADEVEENIVAVGSLKHSRQRLETKSGVRLGWSQVHAKMIDIGRVKSKPYARKLKSGGKSKLFTRMLGSADVPEGMTGPAVKKMESKWDAIVTSAGEVLG